jgi:RHS repeat-associated protein
MRHWTGKRSEGSRNYYDGHSIGMTGLRTIDQRYYASTYGRFNTADQYMASGGPSDPGSWNRYAYVGGDPINGFDPTGEFLEPPIDWTILSPVFAFWGPQRPRGPAPPDPLTDFPECNPGGNATTEKKLNFINDNFADALNAANNFEQGAPGSKVSATALATMFMQWSIGESGYPGDNAQVTAENNWFGFQNAGVGGWSGLEIACPKSSAIPGNSTNAWFSMDTSWGQELGAALSTVSSKTGVTYGQALENALGAGAGSTATLLQAIANNGWNTGLPTSPTYGATKTTTIAIQSQVNCLIKYRYVP